MQVSHSRVELFKRNPLEYKLRYIDRLRTLPPTDENHPLVIGTALHSAIEKGLDAAIHEYYFSYPIINNLHINESMKLEYLVPKVIDMLPKGEFEVELSNEHFRGFIDLVSPNNDGTYDLYDFKYSNNISNYKKSAQLHLYKYFWEKETGKKIKHLYYLFVPKIQIRQKKTEDLFQFRERLKDDLGKSEIQFIEMKYNPEKVIEFMLDVKRLIEAKEFPHTPDYLFKFSEFHDYIEKGIDYMMLPQNERRKPNTGKRKRLWIYAPPFAGKTTLTDKFPDTLILTTDGNINNVTAPYIHIKDQVKVEGRMTKRTFAWEHFKEVLDELEKKQNEFKTVTIDLVEDTREMCRIYMYDKMNIQHESDAGFGKGWDIIKTEYLSTMRRFFNLNYENLIIVSHEDVSKNLTKKSGEQITRISPNIQEAVSLKLSGMVDLVARIVVNDDGSRILSFKSNEVIFGGGRLGVQGKEIPLSYDALLKVYLDADEVLTGGELKADEDEKPTEKSGRSSRKKKEEPAEKESIPEEKEPEKAEEKEPEEKEEVQPDTKPVEEEKPKTRTRRKKDDIPELKEDALPELGNNGEEVAEKPRTRRKRKEA